MSFLILKFKNTTLSQKKWNFQPSWSWVIIHFVRVLPLKTGIVVRLVFSFCVFLPKQFGARHLLTGIKTYLVWPIIFMLGVENMPKFWAFSLWQNADSSPTPWPAGPCSQAPGIYRVQEEAPVCNPTLVRLPPGPQPFPFEAVMLGITERTLCYHPPPHPSLGSASLLLMWKSTSCHHHLCDSPPYYLTARSELLQ